MKRNVLRGIAIALIVMPEPFTTPIGAILLAVSFFLPKQHRDNIRNLETLVRRYLNTSEESGFARLIRNYRPTLFHKLNSNVRASDTMYINYSARISDNNRYVSSYTNVHVTPWHDDAARKIRAEFQHNYLTDSRKVNEAVVHHVFRTGESQYKADTPAITRNVNRRCKTVLPPPKDVYYSSLKPIEHLVPHVKVIHHSIKSI